MITRTTRSTIHKTDPWIAIWALQFPNFSKSVYFFLSFQFHGRHVFLHIFNNFMLKSVSLPCFSPYPIELRHLIIAIRFFTKLRNVKSYVFYVKEPLSLPSVIRAVWSKKRKKREEILPPRFIRQAIVSTIIKMITRTTRSTIHKTDPWIAIWALQFPNFSKSVYFFLSFQFHGRHVFLHIFNNFMLKSVSLPCFSPYPIELRHLIIAIRFFFKEI